MYSVFWEKKAFKIFNKLPTNVKKRIGNYLSMVSITPNLFGTLLSGQKKWRRYRIGHYRILVEVEAKCLIVRVMHIGHRREVYKNN